ncbi:histidine kinase dimerization/phospho-acceptor domain-containing protein [Ureibacillus composti]
MKIKGKLLLTLFLITWVVFAITLLINHGHSYIGKSYFKSDSFLTTKETFIEQLGQYVLEPFNAEKAKENITVTQTEIEEHRNYYGTLADQVENIRTQYSDRIDQAKLDNDKELETLLVKERDAKIADINENFSNDDHVEEKIRKQKELLIEKYAAQQERNRKDFLNEFSYFSYNFTNIETGKVFESGEQITSGLFKETYGNQQSYLTVDSTTYIEPYDVVEGDDYNLYDSFRYDGEVSQFEGVISIPKSMLSATNFKDDYQTFKFSKMVFYIIWATGILAAILLFTVAKPSFQQFTTSNKLKESFLKLPIDVRIVTVIIMLLSSFLLLDILGNMISNVYYFRIYNVFPYVFELLTYFALMMIMISGTIFGSVWTFETLQLWDSYNSEHVKKEIKGAMLYRLADGMQDLFLNRKIGTQSVAILMVAFLAGIGLVGAFMSSELAIIYTVLLFFIGLPASIIFLRRMGYLNRIMRQTQEMADGRLTADIRVKGKGPLAKHATNLNQLREGVKKSMTEQAKSERLKTELITNVSHDLRTPLTSIITYTDLLKNPNITEEERKHYIEVLDKKSARLKTLIEDLFEVSKMASGNIELTKQRVDLTQLLQQAIGEHEEAFRNANLELRITMPDEPLYAYVDGQKWWRVIDNIVLNAMKYSLDGSRVYVTLNRKGNEAEFIVKNIANYELGENVEELTERFKRADASRHTDGSGLGLAIAQSIVDLHGGRLKIDVDGDLFKVNVSVQLDY